MSKNLKAVKAIGAIVSVMEVKGGWSTVKFLADGKSGKLRNGALRDLTEAEAAEILASAKPEKAAKPAKEPQAVKPAKAPKAAKTKRDPVSALPETGDVLNGDGSELVAVDKLVKPDYDRYVKHDVKSPSGRKALDIDDEAAKLLRGQDIADCYFIVAKNLAKAEGTDDEERVAEVEKTLTEQYKHLNVGMQRMNLGNRLRKAMGIYGNRNAHKSMAASHRDADEASVMPEGNGVRYGRRQGEKLRRATDASAQAAM